MPPAGRDRSQGEDSGLLQGGLQLIGLEGHFPQGGRLSRRSPPGRSPLRG
jgi:hypothetical protein